MTHAATPGQSCPTPNGNTCTVRGTHSEEIASRSKHYCIAWPHWPTVGPPLGAATPDSSTAVPLVLIIHVVVLPFANLSTV